MGLGLFTLLDPAGQPCAVTFETCDEIFAHVASWQSPDAVPFDTSKITCHAVNASDGKYATIADLKASGYGPLLGDMEADALRYAPAAGHA